MIHGSIPKEQLKPNLFNFLAPFALEWSLLVLLCCGFHHWFWRILSHFYCCMEPAPSAGSAWNLQVSRGVKGFNFGSGSRRRSQKCFHLHWKP
jgi:hypothetical protein